MEENVINDALKDKIDALGADTIMGTMKQLSKDEMKERADKLADAVDEAREQNKDVTNAAITGDQLEALKQMGYFRKTRPIVRDNKKIGRNDHCPCGAVDENGKPMKYKNCCMDSGKYETTHYA